MAYLGSVAVRVSVLSLFGALLVAPVASAQEPARPEGLRKKETVSSGQTEVTAEGFETVVAPPSPEAALSTTELQLGAGAFLAAGNSRSVAATFSGQFRLRREQHQFSAVASMNYGRSAPDQDRGLETTVENYQGRLRYDYFLSERFALFLGVSGRNDRFQGLALRLNVAPGAAYYVIDEKEHRLWGELGYTYQHDIRTDAALREAEAGGLEVEKSQSRHYGRLFVGYANVLNDAVTLNLGFEYLAGISPFEDDVTGKNNARLGWTGVVNARVSDRLSVATALTVDYDNNPLPGVRNTDATTSLNLVCTLL